MRVVDPRGVVGLAPTAPAGAMRFAVERRGGAAELV
jgi:hypothetical protein